jgi:hypothetical protein
MLRNQCYGFGSVCFWASCTRIRILLLSSKNSKKNPDSCCFVTSIWLFIIEKWCECIFKKFKVISRKFLNTYGSGSVTLPKTQEIGSLNAAKSPYFRCHLHTHTQGAVHLAVRNTRGSTTTANKRINSCPAGLEAEGKNYTVCFRFRKYFAHM